MASDYWGMFFRFLAALVAVLAVARIARLPSVTESLRWSVAGGAFCANVLAFGLAFSFGPGNRLFVFALLAPLLFEIVRALISEYHRLHEDGPMSVATGLEFGWQMSILMLGAVLASTQPKTTLWFAVALIVLAGPFHAVLGGVHARVRHRLGWRPAFIAACLAHLAAAQGVCGLAERVLAGKADLLEIPVILGSLLVLLMRTMRVLARPVASEKTVVVGM